MARPETADHADTAKMRRMSREVRRSALAGVRDMIPLLLPAIPFGLLIGVAIAESSVPNLAGWFSSSLMFAGAAQLTAITLLGEGAGALAAIVGALTVNARHVMYSAALVPQFRPQPSWFRRLGPYMLLDQVFALVTTHVGRPDNWRAYYLGAGTFAWVLWQLIVGAGVLFSPSVNFDISFVIPAIFLSLLVPTLVRRPPAAAALVAAGVTAAFWQVPNRGGMLIGGIAGIVAGYLAEGGDDE
jgi:predicted branched-subunit amino acid permease